MKVFKFLETPFIWECFRSGLELAIGVYAKRTSQMRDWGVLSGNPSVLDVGCGSGHFCSITEGEYVGLDFNEGLIKYAQRKRGRHNRSFRCADVAALIGEKKKFDVVLLVDVLHHLSDDQCEQLLRDAARVCDKHIVNFEPLKEQPHPIGRWRVNNDLGGYMRSVSELDKLFECAALEVQKTEVERVGFEDLRSTLLRPSLSGLGQGR